MQPIEIVPVFVEDEMCDYSTFEDKKIYISRKYNVAIHRCLCGCGGETVMPINHGEWQYGWDMIEENGKVSFTPSVGNWNFECRSHYVITNNVAIPV